jgi:hypothetical protein
MARCVGCGAELDPSWKYCIHCGIPADAHEIPPAIRPESAMPAVVPRRRAGLSRRSLIIGAVGVFVIVVALLVLAFVYLTGAA